MTEIKEHHRRGSKSDPLQQRLGPSSRARAGAFEESPEALSGAINFGIICTLLYTAQKCIDNYYSKGYVVDFELLYWLIQDWPIAIALQLAMLTFCIVTIYPLTTLSIRCQLAYPIALSLYIATQIALGTLPLFVVFTRDFSPLLGTSTTSKGVAEGRCCDTSAESNATSTAPEQASSSPRTTILAPPMPLNHFLYFLMAPTLIYETKYPRSPKIRWLNFFNLLAQTIVSCFVMYLLIVEELVPVYRQSLSFPIWRAIMRLSLPSFAMWLLIFYLLFHCILGMIAEITTFADREFYLDWWNAKSFSDWWRRWNRPVHRWLARHIYFDSMHTMNYDRDIAALATFAISALVHEVVLAVAFKMFRPILFTFIILQLAVIYLTNLPIFSSTGFGNATMWLCLMLGQPGVQILYAREWMMSQQPHHSPSISI